jgi:7-cyano-7-deazaguanine reductase
MPTAQNTKKLGPKGSSKAPLAPAKASLRSPIPSGRVKGDQQDSEITLAQLRPDGQRMIEEAKLLRFRNRTKHRRYAIEFGIPEFTCLCPASGFPDFAHLQIKYVPKDWCVELKSLKLYINQYRNKGVFHEDVCNVVLDDLVKLLDPWEMEVVGDFAVRGNIKTIIRANHKHPEA